MIDLRPIRTPRMPFLMWLGMWWSFLWSVTIGLGMLGVGLRWLFGASLFETIPSSQTLVLWLCFGTLGANLWIVWYAFRRRLQWGRLPALTFWVTLGFAYATAGIVSGEPAMLMILFGGATSLTGLLSALWYFYCWPTVNEYFDYIKRRRPIG